MTRHIVILGLMGSGKSTLGRALAERLGRPFVDNDRTLEASQGRSARAIADTDGLDALHRLEARILLHALRSPAAAVIDGAASAVDDEECRRALSEQDHVVVWLRGSAAVLAQRAAAGAHRPYEDQPLVSVLEEQIRRREPYFRQVADITVDVDRHTPLEVLELTLSGLPPDIVAHAADPGGPGQSVQ